MLNYVEKFCLFRPPCWSISCSIHYVLSLLQTIYITPYILLDYFKNSEMYYLWRLHLLGSLPICSLSFMSVYPLLVSDFFYMFILNVFFTIDCYLLEFPIMLSIFGFISRWPLDGLTAFICSHNGLLCIMLLVVAHREKL